AEAALRVVPFVEPVQHSQQAVGGDLDIEIRAELTGLDALANDLLPAALVFFRGKTNHFAETALHRLAFAQIDEEVRVVAVEGFEMRRDRPPQLFRRAPVGCCDLADRAIPLRDRLLYDEVKQVL